MRRIWTRIGRKTRRARPSARRAIRLWMLLGSTLVAVAGPAGAQGVRSNLTDDFVDRGSTIELTFERAAEPSARWTVLIGEVDVTDLFEPVPTGLRYAPEGLPLPAGRTELVVYRVVGPVWTEAARFPLNVLGRLGFESGTIDPSVSTAYTRQLDRGATGQELTPASDPRLDIKLDVRSEHVRSGLTAKTRASFVGVGDRGHALRFGTLAEKAPRFDLASYSAEVAAGPLQVAIGHVSVGNQRLLVNNFASRGTAASLRPHPRLSVDLGVVGGSSVVGYDDLLGGTDPDHRLLSGSFGFEAFNEPGRLRLEVAGLTGAVESLSGFNQGAVTDAERSRGAAARMLATVLDRRIRLDLGVARSEFEDGKDPQLEFGGALVPLTNETRSARYAEASADVVRGLMLGPSRSARLSVGFRHERIDPQYRSVGAYTQSDRLHDQVSAQADVGGVGIQVGHARSRNNLEDVASILTQDTRRTDASVRLPLGTIAGNRSPWLPSLQGQWTRTHQVGRDLPTNGGFSESHVPDQLNRTARLAANWNAGAIGLGVRWNRSDQDNRQPGRENADFENDVRSLTGRWAPWSRLSINGDLGVERASNLERGEVDETTRYGLQVSLQLHTRTALSLRVSNSRATRDLALESRLNRTLDAQLTSIIPGLTGFDGQWFLRFAHTRAEVSNPASQLFEDRRLWTLDSGFSLSLF